MDGQLHQMLDVTIYYEGGIPSYWDYVCGRVKRIHVHVQQLPIPAELTGDYEGDTAHRARFQQWVNNLWQRKDDVMESLRQRSSKLD
jgi:hypothetical protein